METLQTPPAPVSLLYTAQHEVERWFLEERAWYCNPWEQEKPMTASLWMWTSYEKQLYWILPTSAAEALPIQACNLLSITVLTPLWGFRMCHSNLQLLWYTCWLPTSKFDEVRESQVVTFVSSYLLPILMVVAPFWFNVLKTLLYV
jgi:hypothetical protein